MQFKNNMRYTDDMVWKSNEILDHRNWRGRNLLGKAFMKVREYYRN